MANRTLTQATALAGVDIASNDELWIWDVTAAALRKCTRADLIGGVITGGGTVATGGFTLTVPATGTAALRDVANTFTANQTVQPTSNSTSAFRVLNSTGTSIATVDTQNSRADFAQLRVSGLDFASGLGLETVRFSTDSGGSAIFQSFFGDIPIQGDLFVVEIGTTNYLRAVVYKPSTSVSPTVTVLASSVLTIGARNAAGSIVIDNATVNANVRMMSIIRKIYV